MRKTRKDYLGILNICVDATEQEVKTNYRKTARIYPPDKNDQLQPACHQTKRRNILMWLTMRMNFYARMRNG